VRSVCVHRGVHPEATLPCDVHRDLSSGISTACQMPGARVHIYNPSCSAKQCSFFKHLGGASSCSSQAQLSLSVSEQLLQLRARCCTQPGNPNAVLETTHVYHRQVSCTSNHGRVPESSHVFMIHFPPMTIIHDSAPSSPCAAADCQKQQQHPVSAAPSLAKVCKAKYNAEVGLNPSSFIFITSHT
jgi:hypothetical protein